MTPPIHMGLAQHPKIGRGCGPSQQVKIQEHTSYRKKNSKSEQLDRSRKAFD